MKKQSSKNNISRITTTHCMSAEIGQGSIYPETIIDLLKTLPKEAHIHGMAFTHYRKTGQTHIEVEYTVPDPVSGDSK